MSTSRILFSWNDLKGATFGTLTVLNSTVKHKQKVPSCRPCPASQNNEWVVTSLGTEHHGSEPSPIISVNRLQKESSRSAQAVA